MERKPTEAAAMAGEVSFRINRIRHCCRDLLVLEHAMLDVQGLMGLESCLQKVEALCFDVETTNASNLFVSLFVKRLQSIADYIEDVLDDLKVMIVKPRPQLWGKRVCSLIPFLCRRRLSLNLQQGPGHVPKEISLKNIRDELELLSNFALHSFVPEIDLHRLVPVSRHVVYPYSIHQKQVYGRDRDKISLLNHLLPPNTHDGIKPKVISIVGFGGSGKTTLARLLYEDQDYFEIKAWVCVPSTRDMRGIPTAVLDSLLGTPSPHADRSEFDILQIIEHSVSGKIFLIVLDDVWDEDYKVFWEPLKYSLRNGAPGSIILVTTRSETVADQALRSDYKHSLGPLSNSDCYSILKEIALSTTSELSRQQVKKIGWRIAKKCKGSPLVARIVGNMLLSKDTAKWEEVSHSEIWELEEVAKELFRHFYLSYEELPSLLKSCLSFCALLPKSTVINVHQLIRLWMSQGFLDYSSLGKDGKIMEMNAIECFNILASRSFFQELIKDSIHKNKITSCKMHDAAHDFITYMASASGFHGNEPRFLMISRSQVPQGFFRRLKYVRALVLSSCYLEELPSEVGNLTLLRYLDLSGNPLKKLPEAVCHLCCLESLYLHFCYLLLGLPQQIGGLGRLKHLRINYTTDELHNLPQGFKELTLIQTLDVFRAGGRYKDSVKLLRDLNHLEEICIALHGEVHFGAAKLESKTLLENLELSFVGEGRDQEKASTSMKDLKPPPNLQMLKFEDYPGLKLPKWILAESLINKLRRLSLRSSLNISFLPALWKLSYLEFLWLYDIPNLKHLGGEFFGLGKESQDSDEEEEEINDHHEEDEEITGQAHSEAAFRSLKTLRIEYLENWETWYDLDEDGEERSNQISVKVMPSLEELTIASCPKLQALPCCLLGKIPSLKIEFNGQLGTGETCGSLV